MTRSRPIAFVLCGLLCVPAPAMAQKLKLEDIMKPYEAKTKPDYAPLPSAPPARSGPLPKVFTSDCHCKGCGCKGGSGWRGPNGQCVSHANLTFVCGAPPSKRCTHEGARQVC
jgi:hypothetical protein